MGKKVCHRKSVLKVEYRLNWYFCILLLVFLNQIGHGANIRSRWNIHFDKLPQNVNHTNRKESTKTESENIVTTKDKKVKVLCTFGVKVLLF